jgi:hypothetical protein
MIFLLSSVDTWTSDDTQGACMLGMIVILYFVRNQTPFLRSVWNIFVVIITIIFAICTFGLLRDWAKNLQISHFD